jgi:hypothetical protein
LRWVSFRGSWPVDHLLILCSEQAEPRSIRGIAAKVLAAYN